MEIRYYWEIIKKWLWLLIVGITVGAVGGYLLTRFQTPLYSSTTKVMISSPSNNGSMSSSDYYYLYNQDQLVQTYTQILSTQPILDQISTIVGLEVKKGEITGNLINNTRIFQITATHPEPEYAAKIANSAVTVLMDYNTNLQAQQFASSEESLQAQITQMENQIAASQQEISDLEQSMDNKSSENISDQIASIQDQMTRLEQAIIPQKTGLVSLQRELEAIQTINIYTGAPVGTQEEIDALNQEIFQRQFDLDQANAELDFYRTKYFTLLEYDAALDDGTTNEDNYELQQLKSNLALYQQMYTSLVANYENVRLERLRNTPIIVQVEMAIAPEEPVSPKLVNNIGLGIALGLMLAGGTVFLIEYLNDKIQLPEQVEAMCDLPVIGVISEIPKQYRDTVLMNEKPRSPMVEAFRIMRNNIELTQTDGHEVRSLMVISPNPGDGKSTVSANLAAAYAQQGRKTLLVDSDLRKPMIHKLYHLDNKQGFSNLLIDGMTEQSIQEVTQAITRNLSVITSGSLSDETPDMIAEQAPVFVHQLEQHADRLVFDCPPVLFSETFALAKEVDGVVVIIKPGETKIKSLKRLLEQMNWIGAKVVGILFNQVSEKKHGYYYEHYYSSYAYKYSNKYRSYYNEPKEAASDDTNAILTES